MRQNPIKRKLAAGFARVEPHMLKMRKKQDGTSMNGDIVLVCSC
jgi:hypothetical protein